MRGMTREQLARAWRDFNKSLDVNVRQMPDRKFKCIHCGHVDETRYDVADMLWEHAACEWAQQRDERRLWLIQQGLWLVRQGVQQARVAQ